MSIVNKKGIDISDWQGDIDLAKVKKAGYQFVMIKCGIGSDIKSQDDTQFENNVKKAEKVGLPWGVYLYSYATNKSEAESEVSHVVRLLKGKKPTMPIALDVEDSTYYQAHGCYNKEDLTLIVGTFLSGIKKAGYYPMLYTGKYWLDTYIDKSVYIKYDIWIACWTSECLYKGKNLGMWQYSGEENAVGEPTTIPGIKGNIDKDIAYKDYPTIIKKGGYNNWKKVDPDKPTEKLPLVTYRVRTNKTDWLDEVVGLQDFAGMLGRPITDVAIKVTSGKVQYRVKLLKGKWLPWVSGYNIKDTQNGFAGIRKPIDCIQIKYTPVTGKKYKIKYRVAPITQQYYSWQYGVETTDGQDGYAGSNNVYIDRLQITIVN